MSAACIFGTKPPLRRRSELCAKQATDYWTRFRQRPDLRQVPFQSVKLFEEMRRMPVVLGRVGIDPRLSRIERAVACQRQCWRLGRLV